MNLELTLARIYYRMPDSPSIIQEFIWQDFDKPPAYPRFQKLIEYWDKNIEGPIDSIDFCSSHVIDYNLMFVDYNFTIH